MSTTVAQKVNGQDCLILKLPVEVFSSIIGLAIEAESCKSSNDQFARLRTAEFEGTAPFKKLELDKFGLPSKVLEALVRWPKELHALSCHPTISQIDSREWTWDILQPIFNIHMASLRELHIYDLYLEDHIELADLTGFTMLERLILPAKLTGLDKRYIPCIIAPNLQFFKWQVEYEDGDQRIIDEEHEEWVRAVVEFAAKQQQKLKTIFIDVGYSSWELLGSVSVYPWDLLNDIDRDSERFGIRIRYDEPDISREEFEVVVHEDPDDNFD
ncbi:hypothetical protein NW768_011136 [Fusarium equiseti]|uniref:F-box protein n=1 Tax=Fusarium equiseti TaxID=61235 RepID=A0ABQ8QYI1_FUSEQ|nr:hypothetical protein NW768_011136 [Fusarium equiseti]